MRVVDADVMRKIDACAINKIGMPGLLLMENAAVAVADSACEFLGSCRNKNIVILAGKGNNGGDGTGAARWLSNRGASVRVLLTGNISQVSGDAAAELDFFLKGGGCVEEITDASYDFVQSLKETDLIIDALSGTGFKGELSPLFKKVCAAINSAKAPVLAVDIPTGVEAGSGRVAEAAVKADITVTMVLPKTGLLLYPGVEHTGKLIVADIGMPAALLSENKDELWGREIFLTDGEFINGLIPVRRGNCHKGQAGRVAVIAGSPGFTGAAALCSEAAVRGGAGLVSLYTPAEVELLPAERLTEVMVSKIAISDLQNEGTIAKSSEQYSGKFCDRKMIKSLEQLQEKLSAVNAVAIGPGLGTDAATAEAIRKFVSSTDKICVVDADALTALGGHTEILAGCKASLILTPHPGEMSALTGLSIEEVEKNRIELAGTCAEKWQCVLVLKGAPTVTALPDGKVFINNTGNAAMATGGSGDVLAGIIAALAAQGLAAEDAAVAAVYLHGLAGDMAAQDIEAGMKAGDIIDALPFARTELRNCVK